MIFNLPTYLRKPVPADYDTLAVMSVSREFWADLKCCNTYNTPVLCFCDQRTQMISIEYKTDAYNRERARVSAAIAYIIRVKHNNKNVVRRYTIERKAINAS